METEKDIELQTDEEKALIEEKFQELLSNCKKCNEEELKKVTRAFRFADSAHMGVRRKSGVPYILHPIAVANIVAKEIGLGHKSVCAALMHDIIEDTDYTQDDIRARFGDEIAVMVGNLTKIQGAFEKDQSKQAENLKKVLLSMVDDIRVILIKLADRLHNMRTLDSMSKRKQIQISSETLYMFAPLAYRLGFFAIKSELEDLSLKYYEPEAYNAIKEKIAIKEIESELFLTCFKHPIIDRLKEAGIQFEINSRFKSIYSIWKKMQKTGVPFEEVYDLFAVRIVFEPTEGLPERTQCWHIYLLLTEIYKSNLDRLRDWASSPKANGYEAIHCTLFSHDGVWVEVQIRTRRMDEIAERGIAAHWKYKDKDTHESKLEQWIEKVRGHLENPEGNALDFIGDFKENILGNEITVYTPKGDSRMMPANATVLDFAYEIHSQVGNRAIAAKVNHQLRPLNHALRSGDQVEIITTSNQKPKVEWLDMVTTVKAKNAIRASLKLQITEHRQKGREIIEEHLAQLGIKPSGRTYRKLVEAYDQTNKNELFSNVGMGFLKLDNFEKAIKQNTPEKLVKYWTMQLGLAKKPTISKARRDIERKKINPKSTYLLKEEEGEQLSYKIAECCKPIPGDEIVGFTDENSTDVIIHKLKCPESARLASIHGNRIVNAQWTAHKVRSFLVVLEMRGIDRMGILNELTGIVTSELNVNIRKLNIESYDGIFDGTIELYVHDTDKMNTIINKIGGIKGMDSVRRIETIDQTHTDKNLK